MAPCPIQCATTYNIHAQRQPNRLPELSDQQVVLLAGADVKLNWLKKQSESESLIYGVVKPAVRDQLGSFAPKFAELNDDVLFGQVWSREKDLSLRDRSLITVTALIAKGAFAQLPYHMQTAKKNGITKDEIAEVITHLSFYVGWPAAWSAFNIAKEVWN